MSDLATIRPKGNATVPADAPLLPAQAFVDNMSAWLIADYNGDGVLNLSGKGLTYVEAGATENVFGLYMFAFVTRGITGGGPSLNLSSNAITNTNAILAAMLAFENAYVAPGTINLSGGTNAAPSGQGISDKAALITAGWTVTTR